MKKLLVLFLLLLTLVGCSSFNRKIYTEDEIIAAVVVDNVYILNRAIKNGFNIDQQLKNGDTLLSLALKEDSLQVISSLLANGADLNKDLPAKKNIGINTVTSPRPPIFYVNSMDALKMFLNERSNLNAFTSDGQLLLNFYIKTKPEDLVIVLIDNDVQLKILDSSEWYPIFWAVNIENEEILKRMLTKDKSLYLLKDKKGNYPIYYANSEEVISVLSDAQYNLDEKNIYGENILGEVYLKVKRLGYKNLEKLLLEKGVNPNYKSYR
ncbi:ankyrin repeat domain-containing protein [Cetobacterium sp. ZOR0034]|uniref:ankyrin repeat domain-containing protein n=1 Tax=Cetobacterium sp. ZOR0034 TaxID=1339239 RepID=UPI00064762DF|nr:ankyrin repeat domain-containing protein [Cetobacterium sp. ZOR0034]